MAIFSVIRFSFFCHHSVFGLFFVFPSLLRQTRRYELTDAAVLAELGAKEAEPFLDALVGNSMFELLVQNLKRLDEVGAFVLSSSLLLLLLTMIMMMMIMIMFQFFVFAAGVVECISVLRASS